MKVRLKKALSLLLALVMSLGCMSLPAFAETQNASDITIAKTADDLTNGKVGFALTGDGDEGAFYDLKISFDKDVPAGSLWFYIKGFETAIPAPVVSASAEKNLFSGIIKTATGGNLPYPQQVENPPAQTFSVVEGISYADLGLIMEALDDEFLCGVTYTSGVPAGTTMTVQVVESTDGTDWTPVGGASTTAVLNPVASVTSGETETGYATLADAVAAAQDGDTITLLQDIVLNETLNIEKSITLDGNNNKISATTGTAKNALNLDDNNVGELLTVTIKDLTLETTGYQVAFMANGDYYSTATLNNVDITCDGECVYSNGHMAVTAVDCEFTHEGTYATGKDEVYYSALIVGYGGSIEATDCKVSSFGNGVATFPSGGRVELTNTDITVNEDVSNEVNAGYALWSRNEDYASYPDYCMDSFIMVNSGNVSGSFKITDKYPNGHANNKYEAKIVITGGTFDNDPNAYVADGYKVVDNGDGAYTVTEAKTYVARIEGGSSYETLEAAVAAASDGDTVKLLADVNVSAIIAVNKSITIDGSNGISEERPFGYRISSSASRILWVNGSNVTVTLKNIDFVGTERGIQVNNYMTNVVLNIDRCSVTGLSTYPVNICTGVTTTLNISDSYISGWCGLNIWADNSEYRVNAHNTTFVGTNPYSTTSNSFGTIVIEGDTTNQTDLHAENCYVLLDNCTIEAVQNGTCTQQAILFNSKTRSNTIEITGALSSVTCPNGLFIRDDGTNNRVIIAQEAYTNVEDKVEALNDTKYQNTVDGTNHVVTKMAANIHYWWYNNAVANGTDCTFAEPFQNGWLMNEEHIDLIGNVTLSKNIVFSDAKDAIAYTGGTFYLTFGECAVTKGDYAVLLPVGVTACCDQQTDIFAAPTGYKIVETDNGNGTYNYSTAVDNSVAQIGSTKYETLEAAFGAAQDGQTITLLDNVTLSNRLFINAGAEPAYAGTNNRYATTSDNKSITLDLNGKNITSSSNIALAGGTLNITGTGTISTSASGLAPIEIRGTGDLANKRTLTIGENVTLNGKCYGLNIFGSNDEQKNSIDVTVDGTINGMLFVLGNVTQNPNDDIKITVNGTVDASSATGEEKVHTGIAANGFAHITVGNNAVVKGESGIEVRAGSLTVNGGEITATAADYSYEANGSGTTTKGAAIAVAQHNTKLPISVTINGGTLTGQKTIGVTDVNKNMSQIIVTADEAYTNNTAVPAGYVWKDDTTEGYKTLAEATYVAQIGEAKYETLADAIASVPTDGTATTVKILAAQTALGGATIDDNRNVVLDLDGKTVYAAFNLYEGKLNVQNGTLRGYTQTINVYGSADSAKAAGVYNELTIAPDATIGNGGGYYGIILRDVKNGGSGSSIYAYGTKINVDGKVLDDIWVMGNITEGNSVIDVNNGAIVSANGTAIALQGKAMLNIAGGTITGGDTGVEVRGGTLNVTGGTITGNGVPVTVTANGNGTTSTGAGIAIAQHTTKQAAAVYISGGTINGFCAIYESNPQNNSASDLEQVHIAVSGGNFNVINHTGDYASAKNVVVYSEDFTGFITGGIYSAEPDADYVATNYKAVALTGADAGKYQVGYATVAATTTGSLEEESVTYTVATTVKESNASNAKQLESYSNLQVSVSGNTVDQATAGAAGKAPAALNNIKDTTTMNTIVQSAVEAAGASVDSDEDTVSVEITLKKSAADTSVDGKVTYEVHPEAIVTVNNVEVGTVQLSNDQIKNEFSFKLYAGGIAAVGQKVKVTHKHGTGSTVLGEEFVVDGNGYITVSGITDFSEFELEPVEVVSVGSVKLSASLTLNDNININLYVHALKEGTTAGQYKVVSTFDGETVANVLLTDPSVTTETRSDGTWYKIKVAEVYSFQMGETANICVLYNDEEIRNFNYSARDYFEKAYANETGTMKQLCAAGLDYGTAAQNYFDGQTVGSYTYHTNPANPVNGTVNPAGTFTATVPTGYTVSVNKNGLALSKVKVSLILGSEVSIKVYFNYSGDVNNLTASAIRTDKTGIDRTVTGFTDEGNGTYSVKITGIKSYELARNYTLTIKDGSSNTYGLTYSPYLYAQQNWNNSSVNNLATLCRALVAYGDYAKTLWPDN